MEMVDILQKFIKAEGLGQWSLHLNAVQQMLPYFAASGHNLYCRSAYLYLQNMLTLDESHPYVFQSSQKDCMWSGGQIATGVACQLILLLNRC